MKDLHLQDAPWQRKIDPVVSQKRKYFFLQILFKGLQIVFQPNFQPSPTFIQRFSQKVTGGGCEQGFQVANEWTRGGETLRRLAIALFTNDSLNEQKVHHWSHQSEGLKSLSRAELT